MHKRTLSVCALGSLFAAALAVELPTASAAPITGGNLVNIRIGDGATTPAGTASPITLDEYAVTYTADAPTGVSLVQSIPLPTSGSQQIGQGGTAAGEGGLTLSRDGTKMAFVGYNSAPGGPTNPGTAGTEARIVGMLNLSTGTVDESTLLTGLAGANAIRNAYVSGNDVWAATSTQGIRHTLAGTSATVGDALTATSNERRVYVYSKGGQDQLYVSRMSGTIDGVATVGTPPPPTTGTQTVTLLPGMPTATNSVYDYFFADDNTLYVGDDRNSGTGGLEKWIFNTGTSTWSMAYSKLAGGTLGVKSLTGSVDSSGNVVLFGATTGTGSNNLYGWLDTIGNTTTAGLTENKLTDSTAFGGTAADWNLRGVALAPQVPEPTTLGLLSLTLPLALRRRRRN